NWPEARSAIEYVAIDGRAGDLPAGPARPHVSRVEEQRIADFAFPQVLVRDARNGMGPGPRGRAFLDRRDAAALDEGKLAALGYDRAVVARKKPGFGTVDDDLANCKLAGKGLAAGFEIDRFGEAAQVARQFGVCRHIGNE